MTGPSGYIFAPCDHLPKIFDHGAAEVNRNSCGGDPESLVSNRSAYYPRDQSLFVYYLLQIQQST